MLLRYKNDMIQISCNKSISINHIEEFIQKNQLKILQSKDNQLKKRSLYNEDSMNIFSKKYPLICYYKSKQNDYLIEEDKIIIWFKKDEFDTKYLEKIYIDLTLEEIKQAYKEVYKNISKDINIDDITFKAQLMKSRYGSCIPKKRIIKLNSILARFNKDYIKTILIHELIHLSVKNHQKDFYRYINRYIPNYKQIIKTLNFETRKYVI